MRSVDIVHFACHGSLDGVDPLRSHLLQKKRDRTILSVHELTVLRISSKQGLRQTRIAYLPASWTAEVKAAPLF
ncbi:hypothetical protein K469DRAFT_708124 [Zopfia rhizophila CBS 207.26]|uniref:CHAT domain-containing protein n=1 Tax=Zopfia rhizophila CBS 207.26 TaxID=1314779 RepID=A0A6A6E3L8_9PEZI|nr:hypothetical protein K469DRAFT_708124 [Zopfia rhizophila CBS 207.26]